MIAGLRGTVVEHTERSVLLDVQGVFYEVFVSPPTQLQSVIGKDVLLYTYLHQRDEGPALYGFLTLHERSFFQLLLTVSGVGPRSALAILGLGNVQEVEQSIANGDAKLLTTVSGVGKKTAERLVVELREKIGLGGPQLTGDSASVHDALVRLGYSSREARAIVPQLDRSQTAEQQVREALKHLGKR